MQLTGNDAARVAAVTRELQLEVHTAEVEDDPSVWLFRQGRQRVMGTGQRGERLKAEAESNRGDDEGVAAGEDLRIVVHHAVQRLTPKQQEALRLKFQFGFDLEELARITGLSNYGAGGLLHLAVNRVGQAICAANGSEAPPSGDQQLTAYALDELDAAERKAFLESGANGKALLEGAEAIRGWCRHIGQVLESGAQLPKHRRKGAPWWRAKALWFGLAALLVVAAGGVYFMRQPETARSKSWQGSGANGLGSLPAERSSATESGDGGAGPDRNTGGELASAGTRPARNARPSWETKSFGKGTGTAAGNVGGGDGPEFDAAGATDPGRADGGTKSRGSPSGPTSKERNPAEGRGQAGGIEPTTSDPAEPEAEAKEIFQKDKPEPAISLESVPSLTRNQPAKTAAHRPLSDHERKVAETKSEEKESAERAKAANLPPFKPGMRELKKQLAKKRWPMPEEVNAGEMLKDAPPPAAAPSQAEKVEAQLEQARSPLDPAKRIVRVSLRAKDAPIPVRPAVNLVFAIDVSKSMAGANRLPLVQEGIRRLVDRLRPEDRVSVVTYADEAKVALPATAMTQAGALRSCLAGLESAGLTNGSEGLRLAYEVVQQGWIEGGLNELVLCTDGNFNLGETGETELAAMAAVQAKRGVRLSVFGFGRNDRNDLRLELLATSGGGRSCYVNTQEEAEQMLVGQINGLLAPVASDVQMTVEFNPALVADFRRIDDGPESGGAVAMLLPGRAISAWYEITPKLWAPVDDHALASLRVGYSVPGSEVKRQSEVALTGGERAWPRTGLDFRYGFAVTEFARILRGDAITGRAGLDRLDAWVQANLPEDTGGYRAELQYMLKQAKAAATQSQLVGGL